MGWQPFRWIDKEAETLYNHLVDKIREANERFNAEIAPFVSRLSNEELARRCHEHNLSLEPVKQDAAKLVGLYRITTPLVLEKHRVFSKTVSS